MGNLFNRLFKGVQGQVSNAAEDLADKNLIPEMEQHIRDAKNKQREVDSKTAEMMGKVKVIEGQMAEITEKMDAYKAKLKVVVEKYGKEHDAVAKIVSELNSLKSSLESKQPMLDTYQGGVDQLKSQKRVNKDGITKMEMELETLKAQETLINAKESNAALMTGLDGQVNSAADASSRLKAKQQERLANLDAQSALHNSESKSLDDELADLGVGDSSDKGLDEWL
jgi:phage shock protein A